MYKILLSFFMIASVSCLAGCATASKGSYCDIAQPIRPSVHDMLTEETKRQILVHDETLAKLCGVKP